MYSSLANTLKTRLSHPSWDGVGAIVGILALIVSVLLAAVSFQTAPRKIVVAAGQRFTLNEVEYANAPKVTLLFDGVTASRVVVCKFSIVSESATPILKSEIVEPISIQCAPPYKIAGIYKGDKTLPSSWQGHLILDRPAS